MYGRKTGGRKAGTLSHPLICWLSVPANKKI